LPQGGVAAFTMVRLSTVLSHRPMAFRRQDHGVRIPRIALRHRTLAVDWRQRRPPLLSCRLLTGTYRDSHDFTGVAVAGQPDPLLIPCVANKRPHLVARDRQSAFFCAYAHLAWDVVIVLVDIRVQPMLRNLDGPCDPRQRDFSSSKRSIRALVSSEMIRKWGSSTQWRPHALHA
jgi:hypothetical protein